MRLPLCGFQIPASRLSGGHVRIGDACGASAISVCHPGRNERWRSFPGTTSTVTGRLRVKRIIVLLSRFETQQRSRPSPQSGRQEASRVHRRSYTHPFRSIQQPCRPSALDRNLLRGTIAGKRNNGVRIPLAISSAIKSCFCAYCPSCPRPNWP